MLDDYTWEEVQVHYEAAIRGDADARHDKAILIRIAEHGKDRTFKKYLRQLRETGLRIDEGMGRTQMSADAIIAGIDRVLSQRRR